MSSGCWPRASPSSCQHRFARTGRSRRRRRSCQVPRVPRVSHVPQAPRVQSRINTVSLMPSSTALSVRTNLADYPVTMAMKDGRVTSSVVTLDCCGPTLAHDAFKAMLRENAFDAGELAIVTYLQAKAYGKPFVMIPIPISGRFQHKTIAYNHELGHLNPTDIEGRTVGVRTYAQTTGVWARGILQHEYGVDL